MLKVDQIYMGSGYALRNFCYFKSLRAILRLSGHQSSTNLTDHDSREKLGLEGNPLFRVLSCYCQKFCIFRAQN